MALTQVGEAPDVPQPHAEAHAGQHILGLVVPLGAVPSLRGLQHLQLLVAQDPGVQVGVGQLQLHGEEVWAALWVDLPVSGFMCAELMERKEETNVLLSEEAAEG